MIHFIGQNLRNTFIIMIYLTLLISTRFYNLDQTARFIWDESSDLVRMHQIYIDKKLTLVGPITEAGDRIYGSLTYYMLLPFAILGNFDPVSPVWGTAFWGILTSILILLLTKKANPKFFVLSLILTLTWFPLLQTSRWAWNPNLIPFWATLSLLLYQYKNPQMVFLSGLFLGLMFHHHYLSFFTIAPFYLVVLFENCKKIKLILAFSTGLILSISPFIIFDLRHPPGLFLTRALFYNHLETTSSLSNTLNDLLLWFNNMTHYYSFSQPFSTFLSIFILILLILDFKNRGRSLLYSIVWIMQLIGLIFIYYPGNVYYYVLPSTIFFLIWVIFPRGYTTFLIPQLIIITMITGSLLGLPTLLNTKTWKTDITSTRNITTIIKNETLNSDLKNINLAVIASEDNNIYGRRYRDLLLINNVSVRTKDEYPLSDLLFVISQSGEQVIRNDPATELNYFRRGILKKEWRLDNSDWKVYLFTKNIN